jgi:hypothetical protein
MDANTPAGVNDELVLGIEAGPEIEDGTYDATLIELEPFEVTVDGEKGKEERQLLRWTFSLDDAPEVHVEGVSSQARGPNSKLAKWLLALVGAEAAEPGRKYKVSELIGSRAQIVVKHNANGFPKVDGVVPMPKGRRSAA